MTKPQTEDFIEYQLDTGMSLSNAKDNAAMVQRVLKKKDPLAIFRSKRLKRNTKNKYRAALKHWARFTEDEQLLEQVSSPRITRAVKDHGGRFRSRIRGLSEADVDRLLRTIDAHKDDPKHPWTWPTLTLLVKLGLRPEVDLAYIQREAVVDALKHGDELWIDSKFSKERPVPVGGVQDALEALIEIPNWTFVADLISPQASEDTRVSSAYQAIYRKLKQVAEQAGLDASQVHPNRLRHSAAQRLYNLTKDIMLVQQLLGHSNIETTMIYLNLSKSKEAGEAIKQAYKKGN